MRHRQRHLHATLVQHITEQLDDLGWITPPVNFAATPVTMMSYEPQQAGVTPPKNAVAVSIGDQGSDEPYELGGGEACDYVLFVDVYAENEPIGVALTDDIKDTLTGRYITLRDFSSDATGSPTDDLIEMENVVVEVIPVATSTVDKRTWRAVKATAVCYF